MTFERKFIVFFSYKVKIEDKTVRIKVDYWIFKIRINLTEDVDEFSFSRVIIMPEVESMRAAHRNPRNESMIDDACGVPGPGH